MAYNKYYSELTITTDQFVISEDLHFELLFVVEVQRLLFNVEFKRDDLAILDSGRVHQRLDFRVSMFDTVKRKKIILLC